MASPKRRRSQRADCISCHFASRSGTSSCKDLQRPMSRRPTLVDLARAAGVSVATVDRVLTARHRVRRGTAERVLGAAEAIGFHGAPLLKRRVDAPVFTFGFLLQAPDAFY